MTKENFKFHWKENDMDASQVTNIASQVTTDASQGAQGHHHHQ